MPPWGGAPYSSASSSAPKRSCWLFGRVSHQPEDRCLVVAAVVADAAAAELVAVADEIVLLGPDGAGIGVQQGAVLLEEPGERVVGRVPALLLLVPLEQRELVDPAIGEHVRVGQAEPLAELVAERRERLGDDRRLVGDDKHQIARLRPDAGRHRGNLGFGQELGDRRADAVGRQRERSQVLWRRRAWRSR